MFPDHTKVYTPLPPLDNLYKQDPLPPLTPNERKPYNEVLEHFTKTGYKLPDVSNGSGELTEDEKFWLSYEELLRADEYIHVCFRFDRFLRGTRWKPTETIQRLETTLKWRREFGLYSSLTADQVEQEARSGTQIILGYDTQGRPAFYMTPNKQSMSTSNETRHLQLAVYMLERCIDLMPPGVEKLNILITYTSTSTQPSLAYTRTVLNIFQTHYPERLSHASLSNSPVILTILLKFVLSFIDPITRAKFKPDPSSLLKEQIFTQQGLMQQTWGGNLDFEYQHEKYWKDLIELTIERRKRWKERWKELGSLVGTREWKYKQGAEIHERSMQDTPNTSIDISAVPSAISISVDCGSNDDRNHYNKLQSPGWEVVEDNPEHVNGLHHSHSSSFWGSLWKRRDSGSSRESGDGNDSHEGKNRSNSSGGGKYGRGD